MEDNSTARVACHLVAVRVFLLVVVGRWGFLFLSSVFVQQRLNLSRCIFSPSLHNFTSFNYFT